MVVTLTPQTASGRRRLPACTEVAQCIAMAVTLLLAVLASPSLARSQDAAPPLAVQTDGERDAARADWARETAVDPESGPTRMAEWRYAQALLAADRPSEAADLLQHLLTLETRDRPEARDTLRVQALLMLALTEADRHDEAVVVAETGYARALALLSTDDRVTRDFRDGLSVLLAIVGRYAEAEPLLRADFERELVVGDLHRARTTGYLLARTYEGLGRATDAREVRTRMSEGENGDALESRVDLLLEGNDRIAAEPLARRLVEVRLAEGDPGDLKQARLRLARALFHSTDDVAEDPRIVEAEALYRALYAEERTQGQHRGSRVTVELGDLLILTAEPDTPRQTEGLRLNEEGVAIMSRSLGPDHPETLARLATVAVYQFGLLEFDAAAASMARFHQAVEAGAVVSLTAIANAVTVDSMLALQRDDPATAWRRLSNDAILIHDGALQAGRRDDARAALKSLAFIDRLRVQVGWRLANPDGETDAARP